MTLAFIFMILLIFRISSKSFTHWLKALSPSSVSLIVSPSLDITLVIIPLSSNSFSFLDTVCCDTPSVLAMSCCVMVLFKATFRILITSQEMLSSFQLTPSEQSCSASLYSPLISSSTSFVDQFHFSLHAFPICMGLSNLLSSTILLGTCSDKIL